MATAAVFAEGLCVFIQSFSHPRGGFYFREEDGREVQVRHVRMIAPNQMRATLTDGEVRTITVD